MLSELCVANYDYLLFPFIIVHCFLFALSSKINTSNKITVSFLKYTRTLLRSLEWCEDANKYTKGGGCSGKQQC